MKTICRVILFFVLVGAVFARADETTTNGLYTVTAATNSWKKGERVVAFQVDVKNARICHMKDIPAGWDISINNDPSWNSTLKATVLVGAAAIDETEFFRDFLVIERIPGIAFKAKEPHAEMIVSVSKDLEEHREIKITCSIARQTIR